MFNRGGIFGLSGLGELNPATFKLNFPTWQKTPQTEVLQTAMQKWGFPGVKADGVWGPCSQQAARDANGGANPGADVIAQWFGADKLGIPASNITAPSASGTCASPASYDPSVVGAGADPGLMLLAKLGQPAPEGYCSSRANAYPNMSTFRCECGPGFYENVETGVCDPMESPQKYSPGTTSTTKTSATVQPRLASTTLAVLANRVTGGGTTSGSSVKLPSVNVGAMKIGASTGTPATTSSQKPVSPSSASSTGKIVLGIGLVAALAGAAYYFFLRKPDSFEANCGEW